MTKFDKLYAEVVKNPKDVKFEDLEKLIIRLVSSDVNSEAEQVISSTPILIL